MKLVIIGIQGSGKSTQGNLLSKKLKIPYLSSGHIFRQIAKEKTPWGRYVKETIGAGVLVPDKKVVPIIEEYLKKDQYQQGYILDGFPRTVEQAKAFKNNIDKAIYLVVSDKEALWRLSGRIDDDHRQDNTLQALRKRIDSFHQHTLPVVNYYQKQGRLIKIDGERNIEVIFKDILKKLNVK